MRSVPSPRSGSLPADGDPENGAVIRMQPSRGVPDAEVVLPLLAELLKKRLKREEERSPLPAQQQRPE